MIFVVRVSQGGASATPPTQQASTDPAAALERGDWHTLSADEVLQRTDVDAARGLSTAEAQARVEKFGPNRFTAAETESRLHAFLRQYADPMQLVLLVAGIGSLYPLKEYGTGILLLLLTVFNAVLGLRQEGKAEAAVAALQKMMIITARVRRDGALAELPAEQLVPGDIVARSRPATIVPADGRLLRAATLEVAESRADRREPAGVEGHRSGGPTGTPRSATAATWST